MESTYKPFLFLFESGDALGRQQFYVVSFKWHVDFFGGWLSYEYNTFFKSRV